MKTIERGYLQLDTDEGKKWMHFSRTSLTQLQKLSGDDIVSFGEKLTMKNMTPERQFDIMAVLCHAGLIAYDLEEDNEIDYNEYKVANWVYEAAQEEEFGLDLVKAFMLSLPVGKKQKGQVKKALSDLT